MSLLKSVVKFLADATPVSAVGELEEGRAAAEGIVRLGEDGEIVSPVNGRPCVAFYYRAFAFSAASRGGFIPRKLKTAEVYHSFELEMDGGKIKAIPTRTDDFTAEDHRRLSGSGHENFKGTEELVSLGTRVRIWGRAKREGESFVLRYTKMEILAAGPSSDGTASKKKRKKKQQQKSKRR